MKTQSEIFSQKFQGTAISSPSQELTDPAELADHVLRTVATCCKAGIDPQTQINDLHWLVDNLQPRTALDSILISQIISLHCVIMEQLRAGNKAPTPEIADYYLKNAARLHKSLAQQITLLGNLRGAPHQRVRIEQITVNGGQAMVASQVNTSH